MTKKDKIKEKQDKINQYEEIEEFLEKHNISGIFHIPNLNTLSIFQDESSKLVVLERAGIEIEQRKKIIKEEINRRMNDENIFYKELNKEIPKYVN